MVRTRADAGSTKVSAAKAPRKSLASASSSSSSPSRSGSSKDRYSGGNPYNPQPIPNWQKGISAFFKADPSNPSTEDPVGTVEDPEATSSSAGGENSIGN